jgi:hypothetical protein
MFIEVVPVERIEQKWVDKPSMLVAISSIFKVEEVVDGVCRLYISQSNALIIRAGLWELSTTLSTRRIVGVSY